MNGFVLHIHTSQPILQSSRPMEYRAVLVNVLLTSLLWKGTLMTLPPLCNSTGAASDIDVLWRLSSTSPSSVSTSMSRLTGKPSDEPCSFAKLGDKCLRILAFTEISKIAMKGAKLAIIYKNRKLSGGYINTMSSHLQHATRRYSAHKQYTPGSRCLSTCITDGRCRLIHMYIHRVNISQFARRWYRRQTGEAPILGIFSVRN